MRVSRTTHCAKMASAPAPRCSCHLDHQPSDSKSMQVSIRARPQGDVDGGQPSPVPALQRACATEQQDPSVAGARSASRRTSRLSCIVARLSCSQKNVHQLQPEGHAVEKCRPGACHASCNKKSRGLFWVPGLCESQREVDGRCDWRAVAQRHR
jgi:hypothetical protein